MAGLFGLTFLKSQTLLQGSSPIHIPISSELKFQFLHFRQSSEKVGMLTLLPNGWCAISQCNKLPLTPLCSQWPSGIQTMLILSVLLMRQFRNQFLGQPSINPDHWMDTSLFSFPFLQGKAVSWAFSPSTELC